VDPIEKSVPAEMLKKANIALLAITGMGCQNCATRVRNGLLSIEGVYEVDMFLNMAMAEVQFDSQKVSSRMLVNAVSGAGNDGRHEYRAQLVSIT
jgi:copper chaperone CopZ